MNDEGGKTRIRERVVLAPLDILLMVTLRALREVGVGDGDYGLSNMRCMMQPRIW